MDLGRVGRLDGLGMLHGGFHLRRGNLHPMLLASAGYPMATTEGGQVGVGENDTPGRGIEDQDKPFSRSCLPDGHPAGHREWGRKFTKRKENILSSHPTIFHKKKKVEQQSRTGRGGPKAESQHHARHGGKSHACGSRYGKAGFDLKRWGTERGVPGLSGQQRRPDLEAKVDSNFGICDLLKRGDNKPVEEDRPIEVELVKGNKRKRKQPLIAEAFKLAEDGQELQRAVGRLKDGFWAESTKKARESRRTLVLSLAVKVNGPGTPLFPLRQATIEGVAAALKHAGLASGDQYINELKLAHVEAGFDLTAWLVRSFTLCKKALMRMRGPVKKAVEFKVEELPWEILKGGGRINQNLKVGALSYAWAHVWMLREIEVGHVKWKHVQTWEKDKIVSLFLPLSKTDQLGLGVKRTLQCCGEDPCWKGCAWHVWSCIMKLLKGKEDEFIFAGKNGKMMTKDAVIKTWQLVTNGEVTGHSARRSGAMWCVRAGMTIEDLAFLGRWKSSVVISYAEDALQDVPANSRLHASGDGRTWGRSNGLKLPKTPVMHPEEAAPSTPAWQPPMGLPQRTRTLWAATATKMDKNKVWHRVVAAGWHRPLTEWSAACGWHFVDKGSKVALAVDLSIMAKKCQKCKSIYSSRDDVNEGTLVADIVGSELDAAMGSNSVVNGAAGIVTQI